MILRELKKIGLKVIQFLNAIGVLVYKEVIRPINKQRRRNSYEKRLKMLNEAKGIIISEFEPMLIEMLSKTLYEYRESKQGNYYTIQACHDIENAYKKKLQEYIIS